MNNQKPYLTLQLKACDCRGSTVNEKNIQEVLTQNVDALQSMPVVNVK